jgi:hypothetical protein
MRASVNPFVVTSPPFPHLRQQLLPNALSPRQPRLTSPGQPDGLAIIQPSVAATTERLPWVIAQTNIIYPAEVESRVANWPALRRAQLNAGGVPELSRG